MKHFSLRLFTAMFILSAVACTENNKFLSDSKSRMKSAIREVINDPNPKIGDIDVVYAEDSLVILQSKATFVNVMGGYSKANYEYVAMIFRDGVTKDYIHNISEESSFEVRAHEFFDKNFDEGYFESKKSNCLHIVIIPVLMFNGRKVEE